MVVARATEVDAARGVPNGHSSYRGDPSHCWTVVWGRNREDTVPGGYRVLRFDHGLNVAKLLDLNGLEANPTHLAHITYAC